MRWMLGIALGLSAACSDPELATKLKDTEAMYAKTKDELKALKGLHETMQKQLEGCEAELKEAKAKAAAAVMPPSGPDARTKDGN